jgi:hypothetical protein
MVGGCDDYYIHTIELKKTTKWIEQGYDDVHLEEVANG